MILFTTSRCYRELVSPPPQESRHKQSGSPSKMRQASVGAVNSGGGSGSGGGGGSGCSKGEFDPLIETVKAARSCSTIITTLLAFPRPCPQPGSSAAAYACLTLSSRASMAMDMVSSTAFGEAVREAMVRSPSRELRTNTMSVLASLARIDREIAGEVYADGSSSPDAGCEGGAGGGRSGGFISQTTVMVSIMFVVSTCRFAQAAQHDCREAGRLLRETREWTNGLEEANLFARVPRNIQP